MPLSNYSKDKFVAPEMSKFTSAAIPDMSRLDAEQDHWRSNFILNVIFRADVPTPQRQQMYNFVRRSHSVFEEYESARGFTLGYLEDPERILRYLDAIGHWEAFLAYTWQAYCFIGRGKVRWFERGDGSVLQRLNALHNRAKHADEAIERGEFIEDSPLCVWLRNDGLRSTETGLTFEEIVEILEDIGRWASAVQDPLTMREKLASYADG